jgi:pyruvate,water dikinase
MSFVTRLQDVGADSAEHVGGKAANLGEMLRAGLPVPPGFVLTTDAYRHFVAANALQPQIERLAGSVAADDAPALDRAAGAIAALFAGGAMPQDIVSALRESYRTLGAQAVAVRSSATAEDLAGASFAGQMESFLNVQGEEALLAAVRRCWASLWTARAISYRARQGIAPAAVSLAVVVQQFVEAEAAGVLFTANPVSGHRGQMVVDAVWGLGEALVGGQASPDHWVLDGPTGRVLHAAIARKTVRTATREGGTYLADLPAELREWPVLNEGQLADLATLGRRAAAYFGRPQDIEWAVAGGRLYLVQSRPITSLFPLPQPEPPPEAGLRVYLCFNVPQGVVEPINPLGLSVFRCLFNVVAGHKYGLKVPPGQSAPAFAVAAGRIFLDITAPLKNRWGRSFLPRLAGIADRHIADILALLVQREPGLAVEASRLPGKVRPGYVLPVLSRMVSVLLSPETVPPRLVRAVERATLHFEQQAEQVRAPAAARRFIEEKLAVLWPAVVRCIMPLVFPGLAARFLSEWLLGRWLNDPAALQPVLRSLPHNPTMEMDLELWRISRQLKAEGVEPSADHPAVRAFLARYGHRGLREIDVGMPRWRDSPGHVLEVLHTYLAHEEGSDPPRQFEEGERVAEEAMARLVARVRQARGRLRAGVLAWLLRRIRALVGRREYPKFLIVRLFAAIRRMLLRAGAALAGAGRLDRAEDVFFLDLNDLDSPGDLRAVAARNRADYERELGRKAIPRVMTSEGETFYTAPGAVPGALVGTAASPGVYEGPVRVVLDPSGARLAPGEVLVAPGTDPAWTPLFLSAGALVTELGGIMTHGSVVAREYGIPAVVGVPDATHLLHTGQRVRVDGESGQVVQTDSCENFWLPT